MDPNIISLDDYRDVDGFGIGSQTDVDALNKALNVGYLSGSGTNGAEQLKLQSLELTLKNLSFKESDVAFWLTVPKLPAYSTVEEYNRLLDYGIEAGGFFGEGEAPEESDATYERKAELVKYIGTTKSVSHVAQLVNTNVGNMVTHQTENGTKWVLRAADRALHFGDSSIVPHEWNGFLAQHKSAFSTPDLWHNSDVVYDVRGGNLTEANLENLAEIAVDYHAAPDLLLGSPATIGGYTKQYHESKFIQPNTAAVSAGEVGMRVNVTNTQFGKVKLGYDKFLRTSSGRLSTAGATHPKAPAAPVADIVTPVVAVADALNEFGTDFSGDYFVGVAAVNRYGESQITMMSASAVAVAATEALDLKFAAGAGAYTATGYVIYRSVKDDTGTATTAKLYPVGKLSVADLATGFDGGAPSIARDRNRFIPDTDIAYLVENTNEIWSFKQLAPMMKMDLARISTSDRFMILLYGTPQLYAPKKVIIIKNIGRHVSVTP